MPDLTYGRNGCWDLDLGNDWVAEFTRDSHGFKFWTLRFKGHRMTGDAGEGVRVPAEVSATLKALASQGTESS